MANRQTGAILRQLQELLEKRAVKDLSDAQLLRRFARHRDEAAFAALVQRHGRLVWGVCQHVLHHEQDAEDAFQGTFLVLARKAGSIRDKTVVGSWLYGVAYRIARKARLAAARRRNRETRVAAMAKTESQSGLAWRELQAMLDEELSYLPEKYRAPFVLCCLEGKGKKQAADELGWKEGTLSSRLAQARKLLQQRLARRGVTLSALLCGTALAQDTASATVPVTLTATTIQAASAFATGTGPATGLASMEAVALAQGMLKAMAAFKLKYGVALVVLMTMVGAGAGMILRQRIAQQPHGATRLDGTPARPGQEDNRQPGLGPVPVAALGGDPAGKDAEEEMTVRGRVVDANGQPLPGAEVAVVAEERRQPGEMNVGERFARRVLGSGHTDNQGGFDLTLPRTSVERNYRVALLAASPGHGLSWYALTPGQSRNVFECRLEAGHEQTGRLLDAQGKPAAHVQVHVVGLADTGQGSRPMRFLAPPQGLHPWPAPVTTDEQGNFLLRDVGPDWEIDLQVHDERFAPQWLVLQTGKRAGNAAFTLAPRRTLEGTVTCKDIGRPMPNAYLLVHAQGKGASHLMSRTEAQTDERGRFRTAPFPGDELVIVAYPAKGAPYLGLQNKVIAWPRGASRHEVQIGLQRGVPVRGRVVEGPSGRPVAGALVEYRPRSADNGYVRPDTTGEVTDWWSQDARSGPDGTFQFTVLPGPGWLVFKGPSAEYVHTESSARQLECGKAGGMPYFFDAIIPVDLKPGTQVQEVTATLHRGVTLTGQVLAHDGQPAASALLLSPTYIPSGFALWGDSLPVRDGGRFELPGCDPEKKVPVLFFDPQRQEGAFMELSGKQARPVIVRLSPCGTAAFWCRGNDGLPMRRPPMILSILLRGGPALQESIDRCVDAYLTVDARRICGNQCATLDPQDGTMTFSCLVPGATYLVQVDDGYGYTPRTSFTVQPSQKAAVKEVTLKQAKGE